MISDFMAANLISFNLEKPDQALIIRMVTYYIRVLNIEPKFGNYLQSNVCWMDDDGNPGIDLYKSVGVKTMEFSISTSAGLFQPWRK